MKSALFAIVMVPFIAASQPSGTGGFPATSTVPSAEELTTLLSGKSFHTMYADGTPVRTKYHVDGSISANAPGYYDTGRWRVELGKVCGSMRKIGEFCNDARVDSGVIYFRRMNGEVVRYDLD